MGNISITIDELNNVISNNTVKADLIAVISFDVNACLIRHGHIKTETISLYRSQNARHSRKPLLMMKNGNCPLSHLGLTPDEIYSLAVDSLSANALTVINTEKGCALLSLGHLALNGFAVLIVPDKSFQKLLTKHFGRTERVSSLCRIYMGVSREIDAFLRLVHIALSVGSAENELVCAEDVRCSARALCELMGCRLRLAFVDEMDEYSHLSVKLFSALLIIASVTSHEKGGILIPDVEIVKYENMYIARYRFRLSLKFKGEAADPMDVSDGMRAFRRVSDESGIMLRYAVKYITPKTVEVTLDTSLTLARNMPAGVKSTSYWDLCRISALLSSDAETNE